MHLKRQLIKYNASPFATVRIRFVSIMSLLISFSVIAENSRCYGTTSNGYLENGVKLADYGDNYIVYHELGSWMGRNYVHSEVKNIIVSSYKNLYKTLPDKRFKYAETGFKNGGKFKPHKTHQNGLSVDFMVPVINEKGESVHFDTVLSNKFGYDVEFSQRGRFKEFSIDYEAMAEHLKELDQVAKSNGYNIWRVFFDPHLQKILFKTSNGEYLKKHIKFNSRQAWVRHDEHYHVDFAIPCSE